MESLSIDLVPQLQEAGDVLESSGHVALLNYNFAGRDCSLAQGIDYRVTLSHTGEGVLLSGLAKAELHTACDRCLDEARLALTAELEAYYLFEAPQEYTEGEEEFELIVDDRIDLFPVLIAALSYELPYIIVCKDDCKGLCPHCGANFNHESCNCDQNRVDDHHPFAQLQELKRRLEGN